MDCSLHPLGPPPLRTLVRPPLPAESRRHRQSPPCFRRTVMSEKKHNTGCQNVLRQAKREPIEMS